MVDENDLSIKELMNYGINYGSCIPINIHDISHVFDNKKDKNEYYDYFSELAIKLNTQYNMPKVAIGEFLDSGFAMVYESGDASKNFYFDYHNFMKYILTYFMSDSDEDQNEIIDIIAGHSILEVKEEVNKKLKQLRKELLDIKSSEEMTRFSKKHPKLFGNLVYEVVKETNPDMIDKIKFHKVKPVIDIDKLKELAKQRITNVIVNNKYLVREIATGSIINEDIFRKANKEKFLFYLAAVTLNMCSKFEEIDPSIYFVINYYQHKIENGSVDVSLQYESNPYTFLEFSKNLKEYLEKHPNVSMPKFKNNTFSDCTADETRDYLLELSRDALENFDIVETDEVYIPGGEDTCRTKSTGTKREKRTKSGEISKLTLMKRKFYSDNKDKIYVTLMGKNKFEGYIAHVLTNGFVIFEKHDKNTKVISNKYGAAYKMTIHNFNELSKMSIPEIREYVKQNPDGDISYLCHSGNWIKRLQDIVDTDTTITKQEINRSLIKYQIKK